MSELMFRSTILTILSLTLSGCAESNLDSQTFLGRISNIAIKYAEKQTPGANYKDATTEIVSAGDNWKVIIHPKSSYIDSRGNTNRAYPVNADTHYI
jgi:hypothetical protein